MSVFYDYYESPENPVNKGEKHYHARPVLSRTVSTEQVINRIHERCTLTKGDILAALDGLGTVLSEFLQEGQRVHLDRIGYFSVSLACNAKVTNPRGAKVDKIGVKSVKYRADKRMKSELAAVHVSRERAGRHSARLSAAEIGRRLGAWFADHQVMTRREFQSLCEMSQMTAIRHIRRLVEEGHLKNIGLPRQPIYVPAVRM
jgi:predicted histone-like DNA-binding protein